MSDDAVTVPVHAVRVGQNLAATLEGVADSEAVQAGILDDVANALPPAAAVSRGRRHPKARTARGLGATNRELDQER